MRAVGAALLLLAACSSGPSQGLVQVDAGRVCTAIAEHGGGAIAVGPPAQVEVGLQVPCDPMHQAFVDSVVVEVIGPDERSVPISAGAVQSEWHESKLFERVFVSVTFTPDRRGPWTVRARFEPAVGNVEVRFHAEEVRRDAGFQLVPIDGMPSNCIQFGVLSTGTPVCLVGPIGLSVVVGANTIAGEGFAIDGDGIWVFERSEPLHSVGRFSPTRGWSTKVSGMGLTGQPVLAARDGRAAFPHLFKGGAEQTVSILTDEGDGGVAIRQHSIGDRFVQGLAAAPDGRFLLNTTRGTGGTQNIVLAPDGGAVVTAAVGLIGFVSSDDGVVWTNRTQFRKSAGGHAFSVIDLDGAVRPRERSISFFGLPMPQPRLVPQLPVAQFSFDGGQGLSGVLRVDDDELGWDLYDPGPGFGPVVSATRRHAFARSIDGKTLKIIDR